MAQDAVKRARQRLKKEQGTIFKDWGGRLSVALIYPNSYFLGMSNLGFHTIYRLLNSYEKVVCERVFWESSPPVSLESQRPLGDFDVLAFSISYELDYFNIVQLLRASHIPLFSQDRDERHPLLIGGGPCTMANPEPLAPFFDCFGIGEGEVILPPVLEVLLQGIRESRDVLLKSLASLPGVYVPSLYNGKPVARQWAKGLDDFATTSVVMTPHTELGELYLMEIGRGCGWGCRFCLCGFCFRPPRYRSLEKLLAQAEVGLGFRKRLGLMGPAVSDHPQIEELIAALRRMGAEFSASSLRAAPPSRIVFRGLAESGTKTVSLAPESGSEHLRRLINKNVSDDDVLEAIDSVADAGLRQLKLYFMLGLPTETDDDVVALSRLVLKGKELIAKRGAGTHIVINVEPFVPKAGTPFQWLPMAEGTVLKRRLKLIKRALQREGIEVRSDSIDRSLIQGILSKGDAKLGMALTEIKRDSAAEWQRALEALGLTPGFYIHRELPLDEKLPWSSVNGGVKSEYLREELERARRGIETLPCPEEECHRCGVC